MNQRSYTTPLKTSSVPFKAVGVWRAVVTAVDGYKVSVVVPRLSGEIEYGPLDILLPNDSALPTVGDPVLVGFVEGRQDELVVLGVVKTTITDSDPYNDFTSVSATTTGTTAGQVIDSVSATTYRSVKYVIQATGPSGWRLCELLVVHDGTTATFTEYAVVVTGTDPVTAYDATLSAGNVQLTVTPAAATVVFNLSRAAITV